MATALLSKQSIELIGYLMSDERIEAAVKAAGEEGESYAIFSVKDSGMVVLGKTKFPFWNRLIKCQFPLTFVQFTAAVWSALVGLSKGANKEAVMEGLGAEILKKAQYEKEYNWVVKRLQEVYDHFCNGKGGADLEGSQGKSGPSVVGTIIDSQPVNVNINVDGRTKKTVYFPDATGQAHIGFELGIVGTHVKVDK